MNSLGAFLTALRRAARAVPSERTVAVAIATAPAAAAARVGDDPTPPPNLAVPSALTIGVRQRRVWSAEICTREGIARAVAVRERGGLRASSRGERSRRQRVREIGE